MSVSARRKAASRKNGLRVLRCNNVTLKGKAALPKALSVADILHVLV